MSAKKDVSKKSTTTILDYSKRWTESPPCPQQSFLEKLFVNGQISNEDTPIMIKLKYPIFNDFTSRVFGVHFRKMKAKYDMMLTNATQPLSNEASSIPELDGDASKNAGNKNLSNSDDDDDGDIDIFDSSEFSKPPIRTWVWTDHERKCNVVQVSIDVFSGSADINFEISQDGTKILLNYVWPKAMSNPLELFSDEIASGELSPTHPMIHSLQTQNIAAGITEKSKPKGQITVRLPMKVQRENDSWTKRAIRKADGSRIALLTLKGFQDNIFIKDADTSLCFD